DVGSTIATLQVVVDTQAAAAEGLSPRDVADRLSSLSSNVTVTSVDFGDGPQRVRVIVGGADISNIDQLAAFAVAPGVELGSVAEIVAIERQVSLTRVDGRPAATVNADITGIDTAAISADALAAVNEIALPEGIEVEQ